MLSDFETSPCNGEKVFGIDGGCQNKKGQEYETGFNSNSDHALHFVLRGSVYLFAFASSLRYRHARSGLCLSDLRFGSQPEIASHLLDYVRRNNSLRPCIGAKQSI